VKWGWDRQKKKKVAKSKNAIGATQRIRLLGNSMLLTRQKRGVCNPEPTLDQKKKGGKKSALSSHSGGK